MDVEPEQVYNFRIVSCHEGEWLRKGMVFFVRFLDEEENEITNRLLHFSSSRTFTNYVYVTTGELDSPSIVNIALKAPKNAVHLVTGLVNWGYLVNSTGRIKLLEESIMRSMNLNESELIIQKNINDAWIYQLSIIMENPNSIVGQIALLVVEYYNKNNAKLRPTRNEHLFWSSNLDCFYRYLPSDGGERTTSIEHTMYPPEGATICECRLIQWNDSGASVMVSGPKELAINWKNSDKKRVLLEARIADYDDPALLTKQAEVATSISDSSQHELRYSSMINSGDLTAARNEALAEYSTNPNQKSIHRLTYLDELIRSLDPDWFPCLESSKSLSGEIQSDKIMHLFKVSYPFESTGGSIRNLNVVTSQKRIGLNPFVVTPLNYPRIFNTHEFELDEEVQGVRHIRLDMGSTESTSLAYVTKMLQLNTQMLAGIVRKECPALIHAASGYKGYELAVMAKALSDHFSIPWIYEVRSFHEHTWTKDQFQAETAAHTKMRMMRENRLMELANNVVTISESMKTAIIERGIEPEKITVIHNAVDIRTFYPRRKKTQLLRRHDLNKKKVLGYISNMSRREGHDLLIKALPSIIEKHPRAMLLLVGDGHTRPELEQLVATMDLGDRVIFTGNVDHALIKDYYSIIDLFIVPRRRDYAADFVTPLKPYEAIAMKIPLLVSDRPALLEIIGEDRGFSFETENIEHLSEIACACLSDSRECRRRSDVAIAWLVQNRTWELNAVAYKILYNSIRKNNGEIYV